MVYEMDARAEGLRATIWATRYVNPIGANRKAKSQQQGYRRGGPPAGSATREHAGLSDFRVHDLRHAFASFAVADGASLDIVGKALGHTQNRTTERYAHPAQDPVRGGSGTGRGPCRGGIEARTVRRRRSCRSAIGKQSAGLGLRPGIVAGLDPATIFVSPGSSQAVRHNADGPKFRKCTILTSQTPTCQRGWL
jgi:hypothetical protein